MPARKPRPSDGKTQSERFIEMARELGCSEDEAEFRAKLAGIVRHDLAPERKRAPPRRKRGGS